MAIVCENENGTWWAHDPDFEGVYGSGPTSEAALADWAEAKSVLVHYEAGEVNEIDEAAENAEDVRLADEAYAKILAGGPVYSQAEVEAMLGQGEPEDAETMAKIKHRLADIDAGKTVLVPLEEASKK